MAVLAKPGGHKCLKTVRYISQEGESKVKPRYMRLIVVG